MKYIRKGRAPRELGVWFRAQPVADGRRLNCGFEQMDSDVKEIVKRSLLKEQGWLCCYTGIGLDYRGAHIEHLKPQSQCTGYEDVEYSNMLAAYPGDQPCAFGAKARGNQRLPINPLLPICETKFRFDLFGRIKPANPNETAAIETIRCLRLDHKQLDEMREKAINEMLFPDGDQVSESKIRNIAENYCRRNSEGQFPRFCFVIGQAAQDLLNKVQRDRKRRHFAHSKSRR